MGGGGSGTAESSLADDAHEVFDFIIDLTWVCDSLGYLIRQHSGCDQVENRYTARIVVVKIRVQSYLTCFLWNF